MCLKKGNKKAHQINRRASYIERLFIKTETTGLSAHIIIMWMELAPCSHMYVDRLPRLHRAIPSAFLDKYFKERDANI